MINKKILDFSVFLLPLLFFFYGGLGVYGILNNNEGLYAEIAWEMLETGNWVIPHLNGVPYIEKPPLLYWLVAVSLKVFGKTAFAARFVPASFGLGTCLCLYGFGKSQGREKWGELSAWILGSSLGFVIFSRMVFFDGVLTFFLTASALSFYRFYETKEKKYLYGLAAFMAGAVLAKGLVGIVLMGLLVISFLISEKNFKILKDLLNPGAILLFFVLVTPWHLLAMSRDPNFAWFYFVNEHWMRFIDQRVPRDYYTGPWHYYVPRFLAYLIPWIFLKPLFVRRKGSFLGGTLKRFFYCWGLSFFIFFSVSKAKANYYMVVAVPPMALWLGSFLETSPWKKWITRGALLSALFAVIFGLFYVSKREEEFSLRSSLTLNQKDSDIFLYKRFEELSSLVFYGGHPIPIIDSESRDLWYGQQQGGSSDLFLEDLPQKGLVYVLKRDLENFLKKADSKPTEKVYEGPTFVVFNMKG